MADVPLSIQISIHAPRTGSDQRRKPVHLAASLFQSTLPARGATSGVVANGGGVWRFQSTLPARGATRSTAWICRASSISIHAPRTGSDSAPGCGTLSTNYFNPRSPHGERLNSSAVMPETVAFQSTLPARGATLLPHPVCVRPAYFNPRSPHGERHGRAGRRTVQPGISIHAPRTGSDALQSTVRFGCDLFQSTLPARGATLYNWGMAGYDIFQSTLPARGATRFFGIYKAANKISIHAPRTGSDAIDNLLN